MTDNGLPPIAYALAAQPSAVFSRCWLWLGEFGCDLAAMRVTSLGLVVVRVRTGVKGLDLVGVAELVVARSMYVCVLRRF
eukprot:355929-Chlamydomonas_euryale.AAC.3